MLIDFIYIGIWILLIEIIGLFAFPLTAYVCNSLPDRGYSISKILGILLLTYLSWILSYVFFYDSIIIGIALFILFFLFLYIYRKYNVFKINRNLIFKNEILFILSFLVFAIIRMHNPNIYMGEKFMDFAFLNAIIKSHHFPPYDPWFSGGNINFYYYFGYLVIACITKLSGIESSITFNLGVALVAALSVQISFGIGYNLTRSVNYGLLTSFFVNIIGNTFLFLQLIGLTKSTSSSLYWGSSRVIPNTINEFPYFSFLFGDLHAHMIAIPFQLLVISLILNLYNSDFCNKKSQNVLKKFVLIIILGLGLGFLFPLNAWDYPTYIGLFMATIVLQQWNLKQKILSKPLLKWIIISIIVIILSILLYLPFHSAFNSGAASGLGIVHQRTELNDYLIHFIIFLFPILSLLILWFNPLIKWKQNKIYIIFFIILWILLIPLSYLLKFQLLILLIPLIILALFNLYAFDIKIHKNPHNRFILLLIITGALLSLFCELFYIDDIYGPPYERMNTVFKLYMEAWIFWGISAGYAVYYIDHKYFKNSTNSYKPLKVVYAIILSILIMFGSVYPIVATFDKADFTKNGTLDGIDYVKKMSPGDYHVIKWIIKNIKGNPVMLEAPGKSYTFSSRVSTMTGLPTVIGHTGHELVWRKDSKLITERMSDVNKIYETKSLQETMLLINKYNISYIYIGGIEYENYNHKKGLKKFENKTYFEPVYIGSSNLYKVKKVLDLRS
ncbi:MAG: DUF2298 domain-containing protein [Methanosarcinales archaeon]